MSSGTTCAILPVVVCTFPTLTGEISCMLLVMHPFESDTKSWITEASLETIVFGIFSPTSAVQLQLPEVEERSFMQEVIMESGQMLVVSGFEKQKNNDTRYGLGDADFMALGGSRESESERDVLVVILTPQVLISPMDSERSIQQHWGAPLN